MKEQFKALVVDDDVYVRQVIVRALVRDNFKCDVASDGVAAIEKLRQNSYDVAICDLNMPEMNGHALVLEIMEMESRPAIMVLTGVIEPRIARDLLVRGVEDVVAKPAHNEFLVAKARALAERRRSLVLPQLPIPDADFSTEDSSRDDLRKGVGGIIKRYSVEPYFINDETASIKSAELHLDSTAVAEDQVAASDVAANSKNSDAASTPENLRLGLDNIERGMVLREDVLSKDQRLLVGKGTELTGHLIDRIRRFKMTCGIIEPLTVCKQADGVLEAH